MKKTNEFLKECLGDALLILMKKKPFSDITVSEVAALAQVSRSTYYRNFSSLEEVLLYRLNSLLHEWVTTQSTQTTQNETEIFISLFTYLMTIKEPLLLMTKANLEALLLTSFYQLLEADITPEEEKYRQAYHSFGLTGIILSWIKRGLQESPAQMAEILVQILAPFIHQT